MSVALADFLQVWLRWTSALKLTDWPRYVSVVQSGGYHTVISGSQQLSTASFSRLHVQKWQMPSPCKICSTLCIREGQRGWGQEAPRCSYRIFGIYCKRRQSKTSKLCWTHSCGCCVFFVNSDLVNLKLIICFMSHGHVSLESSEVDAREFN